MIYGENIVYFQVGGMGDVYLLTETGNFYLAEMEHGEDEQNISATGSKLSFRVKQKIDVIG